MPILISGIFFLLPISWILEMAAGLRLLEGHWLEDWEHTCYHRGGPGHLLTFILWDLSPLCPSSIIETLTSRQHIFSPFCFLSKSYPVTFKTRDPKRTSHWSFEFPSQKLARRKNLRFLIGTESLWIVTKHWGRNEILSWRDVLFLKNNNWGDSREPWSTPPRASNSYTLGLHLLASPTALFGTLNAVEGLLSRSVEAGAWRACQKVSEASPCT